MSDKKELAKGFTCECGNVVEYPAYVYAHWDEILDYNCPKCRRQYVIIRGIAALRKGGKNE